MRPNSLLTKVFLDGSDLEEITYLMAKMGFLDGQTTNPSNFVKALKKERGGQELKFAKEELYDLYKKRVQKISELLPNGSISVEVYADANTKAEQMVIQAREMNKWISNAHIKLPITHTGLEAAQALSKEGIRLNITLVFSQEQAAAVYAATKGAKPGNVYISPFVGRFYDLGVNGIDLIKNIAQMYSKGDKHVQILAASIRTGKQMEEAIAAGADLTTSYLKAIDEWIDAGMPLRALNTFTHPDLASIQYQDISLDKEWNEYNIQHDMTDKGLVQFADDWNKLIG